MKTLDTTSRQVLTPEEFLRLSDEERANLRATRVVPPQLGEAGFGYIEVQFKIPVYWALHGKP